MVDLTVRMRIFGFGLRGLGAALDSTDALRAKAGSIFILMKLPTTKRLVPCRRTQVDGNDFPWAVKFHPGFAMTGSSFPFFYVDTEHTLTRDVFPSSLLPAQACSYLCYQARPYLVEFDQRSGGSSLQ